MPFHLVDSYNDYDSDKVEIYVESGTVEINKSGKLIIN